MDNIVFTGMRKAFELTGAVGAPTCPYPRIMRGMADAMENGYTVTCKSFAKGSVNLYFAFDGKGADYLIGGWTEEMFTGAKEIEPTTFLISEFMRIQFDEAIKLRQLQLKDAASRVVASFIFGGCILALLGLYISSAYETGIASPTISAFVIIGCVVSLFALVPLSEWFTRNEFIQLCRDDPALHVMVRERADLVRTLAN